MTQTRSAFWIGRCVSVFASLLVIAILLPMAGASADVSSVPAVNLAMIDIGTGTYSGIDIQDAGSSTVTNIGDTQSEFVAYDSQGDMAYMQSSTAIAIVSGNGGSVRTISNPGDLGDTYEAEFDAAGDLYYLTFHAGAPGNLMEVPAGASAAQVVTTPTLCDYPIGLAEDSSGDFYISCLATNTQDPLQHSLLELEEGATSFVTIDSDLDEPTGVTLDDAGDIYLADVGSGTVYEYANTPAHTRTQLAGGILPDSVAVDQFGNLYANDLIQNTVNEYPADSSGTVQPGTAPVVVSSGYEELHEIVVIPPPVCTWCPNHRHSPRRRWPGSSDLFSTHFERGGADNHLHGYGDRHHHANEWRRDLWQLESHYRHWTHKRG